MVRQAFPANLVIQITKPSDASHSGANVDTCICIRQMGDPEGMTDRKLREKVTAEITVAHLVQFASEAGRPLSREDAKAFLNQQGRAYEMWKHMMHAAEEYIKTSLHSRSPVLVPRQHGVRDRLAV